MAHVHYGPAVALNEDGIMPSMSQLADLAAGLIQHMKLDEAWEANNNLQAEIKDLCKNWEKLPTPLLPPSPLMSSLLVILSVLELHPLVACPTMTNLALVKQPADSKGKQKQPLPPQVEPACPPMEDKITPGNLYTDIPMTINKPIIQGTIVLHLGHGNDGIRLETNEVMDLALKEWRPPIWASQKACQKREALRDKKSVLNAGKGGWTLQIQNYCGHSSISKTAFGCAALYSHHSVPQCHSCRGTEIYHATPHHVMAQPSGGSAPIDEWVKFIHQYQNQSDNFDKSSKLSRMFPRALGFSLHPDDDEAEYRALLEWAEVAPANGTPVPWEGVFTCLATMADVATYLAANGIMYHDTQVVGMEGRQ
ncbi:hypothetical protein EDC04DRAFT_2610354 [Pisolithus marmoratus]|nr:hypothetical protein EDC04DRAFT_2610354 [Pisolithus marmoratus]